MTTTIRVADLTVKIEHLYERFAEYCEDYVVPDTDTPDLTVTVTDDDLNAEYEKSAAEAALEHLPPPRFSRQTLEVTAVYRQIALKLPSYGGFVFHGSAVALNGKVYLFTAKSGTGKTTHTNLWLKNIKGSFIINGDKPIIRLIDGRAILYGTPWSGKEFLNRNLSLPLEAVCVLNRGETNRITPVSYTDVFPLLLQQTFRPADKTALLLTLKNLDAVCKTVRFYSLFCNMEDEAALVSYRGMCHEDL